MDNQFREHDLVEFNSLLGPRTSVVLKDIGDYVFIFDFESQRKLIVPGNSLTPVRADDPRVSPKYFGLNF